MFPSPLLHFADSLPIVNSFFAEAQTQVEARQEYALSAQTMHWRCQGVGELACFFASPFSLSVSSLLYSLAHPHGLSFGGSSLRGSFFGGLGTCDEMEQCLFHGQRAFIQMCVLRKSHWTLFCYCTRFEMTGVTELHLLPQAWSWWSRLLVTVHPLYIRVIDLLHLISGTAMVMSLRFCFLWVRFCNRCKSFNSFQVTFYLWREVANHERAALYHFSFHWVFILAKWCTIPWHDTLVTFLFARLR